MDAYQAIVTKQDTRSFSAEPVTDDDLQRILQAGRRASSPRIPFDELVGRWRA